MARVYNDKKNYLDSRLKFQSLSKDANAIIREFGISLNFKGFMETIADYMKADDMTPTIEIETLIHEINCWIDYISDIRVIIFYYRNKFEILFDSELDESKKIMYKNKHFILKKYEKELQKQETVFNRAYKDLLYQYSERSKKYMRVSEN